MALAESFPTAAATSGRRRAAASPVLNQRSHITPSPRRRTPVPRNGAVHTTVRVAVGVCRHACEKRLAGEFAFGLFHFEIHLLKRKLCLLLFQREEELLQLLSNFKFALRPLFFACCNKRSLKRSCWVPSPRCDVERRRGAECWPRCAHRAAIVALGTQPMLDPMFVNELA